MSKADNKELEEAVKILNIYLSNSVYKEKDNDFFKGNGWEVVDLEIPQSIETVLKELKRLQK